MFKINRGLGIITLIFVSSCNSNKMIETKLSAPIAEKIPTTFEAHNDVRFDNYHWMRLTDAQKNADTPDEATQKVVANTVLDTIELTLTSQNISTYLPRLYTNYKLPSS